MHPGPGLWAARKQRGWSREYLSSRSGVGTTAIYDIEHENPCFQWDTLTKLCQALDVELHLHLSDPAPAAAPAPQETPPAAEPPPPAPDIASEEPLPDHLL